MIGKIKTDEQRKRRLAQIKRKKELIRRIREKYELPCATLLPVARYGQGVNPSDMEILQGMLWGVFSKYIRRRDRGECISCGMYKKYEDLQAGHYVASGGSSNDLRFDEKNVNGECGQCNGFSADHLIPMRQAMIQKWGEKEVLEIERKRGLLGHHWTHEDFISKIKYYYNLNLK